MLFPKKFDLIQLQLVRSCWLCDMEAVVGNCSVKKML